MHCSLAGRNPCGLLRRTTVCGRRRGNADRHAQRTGCRRPAAVRLSHRSRATGLMFPTGVTFDASGRPYVVEPGYSYGEMCTTPRLLRIASDGRLTPIATGARNGPWTGVVFRDGNFYVAEGGETEGGRILRIDADGRVTSTVTGLPGLAVTTPTARRWPPTPVSWAATMPNSDGSSGIRPSTTFRAEMLH